MAASSALRAGRLEVEQDLARGGGHDAGVTLGVLGVAQHLEVVVGLVHEDGDLGVAAHVV